MMSRRVEFLWTHALRQALVDLRNAVYEIEANGTMPRVSYIERIIDVLQMVVDYYKEPETDV